MPKMIFINLMVADVPRATAFYQAIGCTNDTSLCDGSQPGADTGMLRWSDTIVFMLLNPTSIARFATKPIADSHTTTEMMLCLSQDSRADVDDIVARAAAAGGRIDLNPADDHGFMYGRSFEDLDGHVFAPMWMDLAAATGGKAEAA